MADIFADTLMLALKIFMVSVFLFDLLLFVTGVIIEVVEWAHDKARIKKKRWG